MTSACAEPAAPSDNAHALIRDTNFICHPPRVRRVVQRDTPNCILTGAGEGVFSRSGILALKNKCLARNNNKSQPFTATSVTTVEGATPIWGVDFCVPWPKRTNVWHAITRFAREPMLLTSNRQRGAISCAANRRDPVAGSALPVFHRPLAA